METTKGNITPGGTPTKRLDNPPSTEADPTDSGEGHSMHIKDQLGRGYIPQQAAAIEKANRLEKSNQELWEKLMNMEQITAKLSKEIEALKRENEILKMNKGEEMEKIEDSRSETYNYHTDEDELERETDWIIKKKRPTKKSKKRKAESSPEFEPSTSDRANKNIEPKQAPQKEKLPPPINIVGVSNHSEIQALMKSVTNKDYKATALNNDVWKINTNDSETYRMLTMKLNVDKFQWFTYEDKNTRPIKVMARGLHPTCSSKDIIEDLESKGLKILDAVNIIKKEKKENDEGRQTTSKRGLPLFMLTFDNKEKAQNIYGIRGILNMKVKIEPVRKTNTRITQCKKCQGYNHTQKYCGREPRCVKCAGKHITGACTITKDIPPKCINCKGIHPASYRGCEVAKQLQKLRDRTRKQQPNWVNRDNNVQTSSKRTELNAQPNKTGESKTYAQIVKSSGSQSADNKILENIMISIDAITKRLDEQNNFNKIILEKIKILESAKATKKQK